MSDKSNNSSSSFLMGMLLLSLLDSNPISFTKHIEQPSSDTNNKEKSNKDTNNKNDNNNKPNTNINNNINFISGQDADKLLENRNSFIDKDFSVIWKILKTPYVRTYYIYKEPINNQITRNFFSEAIYPIKDIDESSALYIFTKDDKIVDITIDEFTGTPNSSWKESDYVVNSYAYHLGSEINLNNLPTVDNAPDLNKLKETYVGKSYSDFKNMFKLTYGTNEAFDKQNNMQLSIFPIISEADAAPQGGLYVISQNDIIRDIKIDRPYLNFELLNEYYKCN